MFDEYPDVLTVNQLIKALSIGKNSIYTMLRNGSICSIKIGNKYIIPKAYLIDYIEKHRKTVVN